MPEHEFTAEQWLEYGYKRGYCGPPVCVMHDGLPTSEGEAFLLDGDDDPCMHIIRLYEDLEMKAEVEKEHAPSVWRASNRGWTVPQNG